MKTLTKAELLRHMADNVENSIPDNCGLQESISGRVWMVSDARSAKVVIDRFERGIIFSKAPKTHTVNGFEVPAPETEEPNIGCEYCIPLPVSENWTGKKVWSGDFVDRRYLERNLVHLAADSAVANAKAMAKVDPFSG